MRTLEDLIGRQVELTFRNGKNYVMFKCFELKALSDDGFCLVLGIESNDTKPSTTQFWLNINEISTLTVIEQRPAASRNKLLGFLQK